MALFQMRKVDLVRFHMQLAFLQLFIITIKFHYPGRRSEF